MKTLSRMQRRALQRLARGESAGDGLVAQLAALGMVERTRPANSGRMVASVTAAGGIVLARMALDTAILNAPVHSLRLHFEDEKS